MTDNNTSIKFIGCVCIVSDTPTRTRVIKEQTVKNKTSRTSIQKILFNQCCILHAETRSGFLSLLCNRFNIPVLGMLCSSFSVSRFLQELLRHSYRLVFGL